MASLIENRRRILLNSPHPERLSGDLLTFRTDMATKFPELMVQVLPVQDLHGYGAAYKAGNGKNLLGLSGRTAITVAQQQYSQLSDISETKYYIGLNSTLLGRPNYVQNVSVTDSGVSFTTATTTGYGVAFPIKCKPQTTYYLGADGAVTNINGVPAYLDAEGNFLSKRSSGVFNTTFTTPANCYWILMVFAGNVVGNCSVVKPYINYPSTVTTYSTYSNICPITGVEGLATSLLGVNWFDVSQLEWSTGYTIRGDNGSETSSASSHYTKNATQVLPGAYYTISGTIKYSSSGFRIYYLDQNKGWISRTALLTPDYYTFKTPANCHYIQLQTSAATALTLDDVQIELGSEMTSFKPYQGTVIPVSWQSDAGTVYKALLNLLTGEFLVTHAIADLGSLSWERNAEYGFFATVDPLPGAKLGIAGTVSDIYCSHYEKGSISTDKRINIDISGRACISDSDYSDASTFEAYLSGVQLVYELASPVEYQLSENQLSALKGVNNIWSTNGTTALKYWTH